MNLAARANRTSLVLAVRMGSVCLGPSRVLILPLRWMATAR